MIRTTRNQAPQGLTRACTSLASQAVGPGRHRPGWSPRRRTRACRARDQGGCLPPSSPGWPSSAATATTANGCPNRSVAMRITPRGPAAMLSGPAASLVTAAASNPVRLYLATQACSATKKNRGNLEQPGQRGGRHLETKPRPAEVDGAVGRPGRQDRCASFLAAAGPAGGPLGQRPQRPVAQRKVEQRAAGHRAAGGGRDRDVVGGGQHVGGRDVRRGRDRSDEQPAASRRGVHGNVPRLRGRDELAVARLSRAGVRSTRLS